MSVDKEYWRIKLPLPYSPSPGDISIFRHHMEPGRTLLLGCTHDLIPLSDKQMDTDPWYENDTVIVQDWSTNVVFYTNIIGDGVLNFSKELTDSIIFMALGCCSRLIIRSFNRRLPNMKVAQYFPGVNDFTLAPDIVEVFDDYSFFIWKFQVFEASP